MCSKSVPRKKIWNITSSLSGPFIHWNSLIYFSANLISALLVNTCQLNRRSKSHFSYKIILACPWSTIVWVLRSFAWRLKCLKVNIDHQTLGKDVNHIHVLRLMVSVFLQLFACSIWHRNHCPLYLPISSHGCMFYFFPSDQFLITTSLRN